MPKGTNKTSNLPSVEEFLLYTPHRLDFEWFEDEKGLVVIKVPKFKSNIGKSFCKIIRKKNTFDAHPDKIGSLVWKNCNGKNTVMDIFKIIKKTYLSEGIKKNEDDIKNNLVNYLVDLKMKDYIDF